MQARAMARPRGTAAAAAATALLLLLLAAAPHAARGGDNAPRRPRYKILTFISVGGSSHSFDLLAVAGRLAMRHDVTVVCAAAAAEHTAAAIARLGAFAGPMRLETVEDLMSTKDLLALGEGKPRRMDFLSIVRRFMKMPAAAAAKCARLVANETLLEVWRAYDMLLTFHFPPPNKDSCACLLSHMLGLPMMYVRDLILTETPLSVPQIGSGLSRADLATPRGMLRNAGFRLLHWAVAAALARKERSAYRGLRAAVGLPLGRVSGGEGEGEEARVCEPWLEAVSANWMFEDPHAIAPPQVMVGAISPHPSRPAIADAAIAAFADAALTSGAPGGGAGAGLVLASFGSNSQLFGGILGRADFEQMALGFADLAPVRVLWLLHEGALPGGGRLADLPLGNNTLVVPWGPVNDILGHPATRAFVTHGGQKSCYEAAFHGVPIVGVPFMVEQLFNAQRGASRGFGVVSPEAAAVRAPGVTFTRAGVAAAVREVLEPRYAVAARRIGEAMRLEWDQKPPADRAAEEIERAMLHGGYNMRRALAPRRGGAGAAAGAGVATSGADEL